MSANATIAIADAPLLVSSGIAALLFAPWLPEMIDDSNAPNQRIIGAFEPFGLKTVARNTGRLTDGGPFAPLTDLPGTPAFVLLGLGLPALATGEVVGCFGLTEPDHGSDPGSMKTRARKTGDGYVLNGTKLWITNGSIAEVAVVWAKEDDGEIYGYLVERGTPGFGTLDIHGKFSMRASITSELSFQDCHIPAASKLPGVKGLRGPLGCLNQARYGIAWGAIGARTTESQVHRELASGLSCPVGFKNGTDGNVKIAVDAIKAASQPHHFLSVTKGGHSAIVSTAGNEDCHIILRGGKAPNYDAASVDAACKEIAAAGLASRLMIDASHANSSKKPENQVPVCAEIGRQIAAGDNRICGVMVESHLVAGRQDLGAQALTYGQSITDACMDWDTTVLVLDMLTAAVRARRGG